MKNKSNISVEDLNRHLKNTGQTFTLMVAHGGITDGNGSDHRQPCPFCEGTDRFRFSDDCDKCFCRKCKPTGGYSIYDLVMHHQGFDFHEALELIAKAGGYVDGRSCIAKATLLKATSPREETKENPELQTSKLIENSTFKQVQQHRPEISFDDYKRAGAKLFRNGKQSGIAIPMYDNNGKRSGWVQYGTDGSKRISTGGKSGIVGKDARDALFQQRPAKIWFKTAGVSDYLVLSKVIVEAGHQDDYYAFTNGAGESEKPDKFDAILRPALEGRRVAVIADNDEAGEAGAQRWAEHLAIYASVRVIKLPTEWEGWPIKDFRNFVARNDENVLETLKTLGINAEPVTPARIESKQSNTATESLIQWQPFPIDEFPDLLRNFVVEVSKSIGIDPSHVAACVLSIVSGVIGRAFKIEIKSGHQEYAMLWVVVIADSGFGKSPALNFAREPIDRLEREARERYKKERAEYDAKMKERNRRQGSQPSNECAESEQIAEPALHRFAVSDITIEALVLLLADNSYGLCLIRDELAALFGGMNAYKNGKVDLQFFIEIHGGLPVCVDRKTGHRQHIAANTPSLSIIGGIQTDIIRRTIIRDPAFLSSGFVARLLMAYPPQEALYWNHNVADPEALSSYEQLIRKIVAYRESISPDDPGIVRLTAEADRLIFDFQNRQADETLEVQDGNVRYALNKAGMHAARLALVLHVVECFEKDFTLPSRVSEKMMQRAISIAEWFLNEAHRIYAMLAGREESATSEKTIILTKIRLFNGEVTVRKLQSSMRKYRSKGGAEELTRKLQKMIEDGLLTSRHEKADNGRTVEWFCIPNTEE
ncbi:MAG: DUF3987 domain-containing protein [Planctomycetaceae bacterium]|nr:DUF3987 domain-containing protein [Planctomycetaceae bacterium]